MVADDGRLGGRRRAGGLSLVDIVAVMVDGIEIGFAADMAPGGEEAAFVMLAARDRDAQAIERRAGGGRGAHRTGVAANPVDDAAIPITAMATEDRNVHVERMRQFIAEEDRDENTSP